MYDQIAFLKSYFVGGSVQPRLSMLLLVSALSIVNLMSAQTNNERQAPIRPVDGAGVFRNYCASCHGLDGRGDGPVAKALRAAVPDLTILSRKNGGSFPRVHVRNVISFGTDDPLPAHGNEAMPIWGPVFHQIEYDQDLGNVRLDNIVKYLESIQKK